MRLKWLTIPFLFALCAFGIAARPDDAPPSPADAKLAAKADEPKGDPLAKRLGVKFDGNRVVKVPAVEGGRVVVVDRAKMKLKGAQRKFSIPAYLAPNPPESFDYTKGNTISFPVLGNDQVGDCYYAAECHKVQTWAGMIGSPVAFDAAKVIARYRKLSGGDNGLSDYDIYGQNHNGEVYAGIVGPNGPHKILDHLTVSPTDKPAIALAMWAYGGLTYTCGLCDEWMSDAKPGATWDKGHSDPWAGHAIVLNGKNADGTYKLQTWGFNPPIRLTQAGLESSDPELIVEFSLEWFDPATGKAPNGLHYTEAAALWKTLGGRDLPPNPFPGPAPTPPAPPTPPVPPAPGGGFTGVLVYENGVLKQALPGGTSLPAGLEAELKAAGVNPLVIAQDISQLLSDIRAKKGFAVILGDLLKLAADLGLALAEPKTGRLFRRDSEWAMAV